MNNANEENKIADESALDHSVGHESSGSTKISKIMIHPSRKISLGNYETINLSAGVEIQFDDPVPLNSTQVLDALKDIRSFIKNEMLQQYKDFLRKK